MPLAVHVSPVAEDAAAGLGRTAAAPVVLLHGFASSGRADFVATGLADALTAAGRTAVVVDLPAHGGNAALAPDAATTAAVVAAILETVDQAVGRGASVDVIGYSLGARLAWELPAASGGRVRRLVLGGISPFEPFAAVDTDELAGVLSGTAEPSNPITGMMAGMIQQPGLDTASLATLIGGLASQPFDPSAGAPAVPTLFIAGAEDPMSQGIEGLVAAVPGARLERVPGDHHGALASPELRDAALAFLA